MARRCDGCGQFCRRLHPIYTNPPTGGIDREVCDDCAVSMGMVIEEGQL